MKTAVLVLCHSRPRETQIILNRLSMIGATNVHLVVDGPTEKRAEGHEQVLNVIGQSEIQFKSVELRQDNLGVKYGPVEAITSFLLGNERGIILEDDTLPSRQFFGFATSLLDKYRNDERVGMISGNNHSGYYSETSSYFFSKNKACWGWATWLRTWQNFDVDRDWLSDPQIENILENMGHGSLETKKHWKEALLRNREGQVHAWDWPWFVHLANENQLCATPNENLVANIGFGKEATHTTGAPRPIFERIGLIDSDLRHPSTFAAIKSHEISFQSNKYFFSRFYDEGDGFEEQNFLSKFIIALLTKMLGVSRQRRLLRTLKSKFSS